MPSYPGSLLECTCRGAVRRQIEYGRDNGMPWGISESCYNTLDANLYYQYRAFRRAGPGFQTRPGRGHGHRSLRLGHGPHVRAPSRLSQPAPIGRAGGVRPLRHVRGRGPHARASAARQRRGRTACLYVPPSGHEPAGPRRRAAEQPHATPLSGRSRLSGRGPAVAGTRAPGHPRISVQRRGHPGGHGGRHGPRGGKSAAGLHRPQSHSARGATSVQRAIPRHGQRRRKRLQPLARLGRHPLARGPHPRQSGPILLSARYRQRRILVHDLPAHLRPRRSFRGHFLRRPGRIPGAPPRPGRPYRNRRSRPRTISNCDACTSPTAAVCAATSN